uniref:Uncharacterized protein n=1 Tax=viral metagenome TaxID=1070528 RepID=A0A6C0F2Q0_9ZZZZ
MPSPPLKKVEPNLRKSVAKIPPLKKVEPKTKHKNKINIKNTKQKTKIHLFQRWKTKALLV